MTMTRTAWQEYNGLQIEIDDYGNFCVDLGGRHFSEASWGRLRLRIEDEKKADAKAIKLALDCVALIGNDDTDYSVQRVTLTGLSRSDSSFKFRETGVDSNHVQYILPYTPKNLTLLEELATARATVRDIQLSIKDRTLYQDRWGGRIEPTKYPEKLMNLKECYNTALKGKTQ